jgi:hypothetical protein
MTRQYNSFLIRCWYLDEHEQRIKIEHIQSGEGTVVATLAAALTWLRTHCSERPGDEPTRLDADVPIDDGPVTQDLAPRSPDGIASTNDTS